MKHQSNSNEPATKGDLQELEERLARKFATKYDLHKMEQKLSGQIDALEIRTDIKFDNFFLKLEDMLKEFKSDIFTKIDSFAREVEQVREDHVLFSSDVRNHEKRISKLEVIKQISQ